MPATPPPASSESRRLSPPDSSNSKIEGSGALNAAASPALILARNSGVSCTAPVQLRVSDGAKLTSSIATEEEAIPKVVARPATSCAEKPSTDDASGVMSALIATVRVRSLH